MGNATLQARVREQPTTMRENAPLPCVGPSKNARTLNFDAEPRFSHECTFNFFHVPLPKKKKKGGGEWEGAYGGFAQTKPCQTRAETASQRTRKAFLRLEVRTVWRSLRTTVCRSRQSSGATGARIGDAPTQCCSLRKRTYTPRLR